MHRVVVIIFDNEAKADEAKSELLRLDSEGSISIYAYKVLAKKADGTVIIRQADGRGTLSPFAKSLLGSLGDSMRSTPEPAATEAGNSREPNKAETRKDFVRDVIKVLLPEVLLPNRVAIVAEIEEEWPDVLDRRMDAMGGVVFRWGVCEVQHNVETLLQVAK